jgi:hypothetical protein
MGSCQDYLMDWYTVEDILAYADSLHSMDKKTFLIVFSAICWCVWKHRNDLCFVTGTQIKSNRNLILLIISIIYYWTGNIKDDVKQALAKWMPKEMDNIPLQTWNPGTLKVVPMDSI